MPKSRKVKEEDAGESKEGNATSKYAALESSGRKRPRVDPPPSGSEDPPPQTASDGGGSASGGGAGKEAASAARGLEPPRRVQKNPGFLEVFLASTLGRALTDNSQVDFLGSWFESTTFGGQKSEEPLDLA